MRLALKNLEARFPVAAPAAMSAPAVATAPNPLSALAASAPAEFLSPVSFSPTAYSTESYGVEDTHVPASGPLSALVDASCAHVVVQPLVAEQVRVALAEPTSRPPQPSLEDYLSQRVAGRPQVAEPPPLAPKPLAASLPIAAVAPAIEALVPQATDPDAPAWKINSPKQELSALEHTVVRLLADPKFALSYGELADRLSLDATERNVSSFALAAVEPWRGHSELAFALAGMLAERGGDVLLVDGGSGVATLSFELGHARAPGLSQWLASPADWSKWVQPTALRNLYFLPSGSGEFVADADWTLALQALRGTFRHVILHSVEATGTRLEVLTRAATATYLTVPLGQVETLPAQQLLARLRSKGARVLGCIAAQATVS
jgi:Mrp family chromosome partitioning ATPase